jgi:hypothetical protein
MRDHELAQALLDGAPPQWRGRRGLNEGSARNRQFECAHQSASAVPSGGLRSRKEALGDQEVEQRLSAAPRQLEGALQLVSGDRAACDLAKQRAHLEGGEPGERFVLR